MAVTAADIREEVKAYNFEVLTGGDMSSVDRAIEKGRIWAKAKVLAAGDVFDEEDEICRQVVIKRALYELYSSAENEAVARDKKEDAMELLRAKYGNAVDSANYGSGGDRTPISVGAVKRGK